MAIEIKKENRGKFTEYKKRTGKSTSEALRSSNPHVRAMANFARMAERGWKPLAMGGPIEPEDSVGLNTGKPIFKPTKNTRWFPESAALSKYKMLVAKAKEAEKSGNLDEYKSWMDKAENITMGVYTDLPYSSYKPGTHDEYEKKGLIKVIRGSNIMSINEKEYPLPPDFKAYSDYFTELYRTSNKKDFGGALQVAGTIGSALPIPGAKIAGMALGAIGGIISGNAQKKKEEEAQRLAANKEALLSRTSSGGMVQAVNPNVKAFGGFTGEKDTINVESGGTHEQNPYGGIMAGIGTNGKPNLVEEGEKIVKIGPNKEQFVISKRIPFKRSAGLPGYVKGETYADALDSIEKAFALRPDKISQDTKNELVTRLARDMEDVKNAMASSAKSAVVSNEFVDGGFKPSIMSPYKVDLSVGLGKPDVYANMKNALYGMVNDDKLLGNVTPSVEANQKVEGSSKDLTWIEKNQKTLENVGLGIGFGSQLLGAISSIRQRNALSAPETEYAHTIDENVTPTLVNKQDLMRRIEDTQKTSINALRQSSSGNFGQYAANLSAIQSGTAKATSSAILQAKQMDAQEIAQAKQMNMQAQMFNAQMQSRADENNAANRAAYEYQKGVANNAIVGNVTNLGQSLINYITANKYGKYKGLSALFQSMANQGT